MIEKETTQFKPSLKLMDATMLVAGSMIGSGIFIVSADITRNVGSSGWLLVVWLITGFMTLTAALSYGELSAMFPKAGGQYIYLKEAYNPLISFLYGWSFFTVIQTATIAAVGVAFAKFTAYLVPALSEDLVAIDLGFFTISPAQLLAIGVIILLTYINNRGVNGGKVIQTTFTVAKLLSLFGLIAFGLFFLDKGIWKTNWENMWVLGPLSADGNIGSYTTLAAFGAIAAAMVGSIFSSDSWHNVTFIAGEIKNPKRNVGFSLFLGTFIVTIIYVLTNIMYLAVIPLDEIATAKSDRVAVVASQYIFGNIGTLIIAIMIMISTFACNNGLIMAGARVYYTMAKDGLFFKKAAVLNESSVPAWALWAQCIWASALCLTGKYGDLLDFVIIIVLIFYILTIYGIFILRKKMPDAERPYKAFGYPFLPMLYIIIAAAICVSLLITKFSTCGWGVLIMLMGIPIYYLIKEKSTN